MSKAIESGYTTFMDRDGKPLDGGFIYIGESGLNPITNPEPVYWDEARTIVAAQPVRTRGGYALYSGSPGQLYALSGYSILLQNKYGAIVYYQKEGLGIVQDQTLRTTDDVVFNQVTAAIIGNVTGNLTGDVTGGVTGNVIGDVTGNADTASALTETGTGAEGLHCKVFELGDWNMDTAGSPVSSPITHGIPNCQVTMRMMHIVILSNTGWDSFPLFYGGYYQMTDDDVFIYRTTGGFFDDAPFNSTSFNRGWMTIWYAA